MDKYIARATAGSHSVDDAPKFDTLENGINYFVCRGWRHAATKNGTARLELWIDHSDDPIRSMYTKAGVPDDIVTIGKA